MSGKKLIGIGLLMGVVGVSHGTTIQETVNSSLNYHPSVKAAQSDELAAQHRIKEAKSGYLPQASVELSSGYQRANNTTIRSFQNPDAHGTHINKADFLLQQLIFDGGGTTSRINAAESSYKAAGHLVGERKQDIVFAAITAHLEVLRSSELLVLAGDNLEAHRAYLEDIERRAEQGVITETDAHHARARYAFADASLTQQEEQLLVAQQRYLEIVGAAGEQLVRVDRPEISYESLDDALGDTMDHPTVQQSAEVLEQAKANYEQTKSAFYPRFNFEVSSTVQDNSATSDLSSFNPQSHETFVGVVMSYDLSSGGGDSARRDVTAAQQASAGELHRLAARDIREAIRTVWYAREKTEKRVPMLTDYTDSLAQVLEDYIDQFSVNRRDLLDLLDRQVETYRAQADLVNAQYDLITQDFELLQATGQLVGRFSDQ